MPPQADPIAVEAVREALAERGLMLRGGFHPGDDDGAPPGTGTLLMVGNAGPGMWRAFAARRPVGPDPLNAWTRQVLDPVSKRFGASVVYTFEGPPYYPFQRWAARAEPIHASPLGILIHPEFGLWHAWRGALCFPGRLDLPAGGREDGSPCESCETQPCRSACPVSAIGHGEYDTMACAAWLRGPEGTDCRLRGCLARRACPVGRAYRYAPEQAEWHMAAFLHGQPDTGLRLRAYRRADAEILAQLFHDSVHRATAADYTPAQRAAWAPDVPAPDALHARLARCDAAVATQDGRVAGFGSLQPDGHIDMFYVAADRQRGGTGTALYRRLEGMARRAGQGRLTADISITARPFFEAMGFAVTARRTVSRGGIELTNFAMDKPLTR